MPTELLTWHVFAWSARNGYRLYDFGGAGKPDEEYGVRDFKAKFGGELVSYGRNVCVHAPVLLQASRLGYSLARRLGLFGSTSSSEAEPLPGPKNGGHGDDTTGANGGDGQPREGRPAQVAEKTEQTRR